jgi:DNA polymerase III sliding clamp (beta) subunit (PCNA family)
MKTSVENKKLKIALKFVSRVAKKNSLEVLNSIHCHANGAFEMTATNLETTCRAVVPCETETEGKSGVPVSFIQTMAENKFFNSRLEINEGKAIFASGLTMAASCDALESKGFPEMTFFFIPEEFFKVCTIPAASFFSALSAVSLHMSKDATRYILNGAFFEFTENALRMTATDGIRLFYQDIYAGTYNGKKSSFIVPTDMVKSILAIPTDKKNPADIEIYFKDERIFVKCGDFQVFGKPIDGNLPNYRAVLPDSKETKHSVQVSKGELVSALERNCKFLCKNDKPQSIFTFFNGVLSITSKKDGGETSASVGIQWIKTSFTIAFNPFLLLELAKSFESCAVVLFELRDEYCAVKITGENSQGVLMPVLMK